MVVIVMAHIHLLIFNFIYLLDFFLIQSVILKRFRKTTKVFLLNKVYPSFFAVLKVVFFLLIVCGYC